MQAFQNGEIRGYHIVVTENETGDVFNYTTSLTQLNLLYLHPYYIYKIKIAALTIASGPFSTPLVIQTLPDGKLTIAFISYCLLLGVEFFTFILGRASNTLISNL